MFDDLEPAVQEVKFGSQADLFYMRKQPDNSILCVKEMQFPTAEDCSMCYKCTFALKVLGDSLMPIGTVKNYGTYLRVGMPIRGEQLDSLLERYKSSPWDESQTVLIAKRIIVSLAGAQSKVTAIQKVPHQLISLSSLLVESDIATVNITNFEPVVRPDSFLEFMDLKMPRYLSPQIRQLLTTRANPPSDPKFPYKSDVWSLGICLLEIVYTPNNVGAEIDKDWNYVQTAIQALGEYPHLQYLLTLMLEPDDFRRMDFQELKQTLGTCASCSQPMSLEVGYMTCDICRYVPHPPAVPLLNSDIPLKPESADRPKCITCGIDLRKMDDGGPECLRCKVNISYRYYPKPVNTQPVNTQFRPVLDPHPRSFYQDLPVPKRCYCGSEPLATLMCGHILCRGCLVPVVQDENVQCPACHFSQVILRT